MLSDILAKRGRATWTNSLSTRTLLVHHDPSLSQNGRICVPQKKSDLADCLETLTTPQVEPPKEIDAIIIDGAVVDNMIRPGSTARSFAEYANESFVPYIVAQLSHAN